MKAAINNPDIVLRFASGSSERRAESTRDGRRIPEVSDILDETYPMFDGIDSWYAERGSAVHSAIALDLAGRLDPASLDPRIAGYAEGARLFCLDHEVRNADILLVEELIAAPFSSFVGMVDLVLRFDDEALYVVDWKAGQITGHRYAAQMGAYRDLVRSWALAKAIPHREFRLILVGLKPNGSYSTRIVPETDAALHWTGAMLNYRDKLRTEVFG